MKPHGKKAFTLLELLVVIGLVAAISALLATNIAGGGASAALHAGQATVANLLSAGRAKAPATGRRTRLLVNMDPVTPERYLRHVVLQVARHSGSTPTDWETIASVSLPEGIYLLPASLTAPGGLVASPGEWKRVSDPSAELVSDLFAGQTAVVALEGDLAPQAWTGVTFTVHGTLAPLTGGPPPKGFVVLTTGVRRPPGSYMPGDSPVRFLNPQTVRGLALSAYGVPTWLNERSDF